MDNNEDKKDLGNLVRAVGALITTTAVLVYNYFAKKKQS